MHKPEITDYFYWKCEQAINDHRPVVNVGNQSFEFEQIEKANDLVNINGHKKLLDKVLGNTTDDVRWMAKGTGTGIVTQDDTVIGTEVTPRVDMQAIGFGWVEYGGLMPTLRCAGIWGEATATITVTEAGMFTLSAAGTMINRNMWGQNTVTHTVNKSVLIIGSVIEWLPVGSIN